MRGSDSHLEYILSDWLTGLERVTGKTGRRSGDGWRFPCPAHGGDGFNLVIVERNGKILTTCHSHGCPHEAVRSALGLDAPEPCAVEHRYEYRRADGELHLTVHMKRDAVTGKKSGRPWREPGGVKGPQPLYRLPELLEAGRTQPVLVVEGEHTCDAARAAWSNKPVVTWAGGCKSWRHTDWKPLRERRVTVAADADSPGREAAQAIATHLDEQDKAFTIEQFAARLAGPARGRLTQATLHVVDLPGPALIVTRDLYEHLLKEPGV